MVSELLERPESLLGDCNKVGGDGLRSIGEGVEGAIKRVVNFVFGAVQSELGSLVQALETIPESLVAEKRDKSSPTLGERPSAASAVPEVFLFFRPLGKSHTLGKSSSMRVLLGKTSSSSGAIGAAAHCVGFNMLLPPSRPSSPSGVLSPAAQLAHDGCVAVVPLDSREAVAGAFHAFKAYTELHALFSAPDVGWKIIVSLIGRESAEEDTGIPERDELPTPVILPARCRARVSLHFLALPKQSAKSDG
ncbi:hypothetical protein FRC07_002454 [Ceratobasidium sp. 392]|nr:hypothetical protein FRC07_002454 [Ceratobasidium sp. 392]